MFIEKIKEDGIEGLINLDFAKTIYISKDSVIEEYRIYIVDGAGKNIILARSSEKIVLQSILRMIAKGIRKNVNLLIIFNNEAKISIEEGD